MRVIRALIAFGCIMAAIQTGFLGLSWVFQGYGLHPLISGASCALLVLAGYFVMPDCE